MLDMQLPRPVHRSEKVRCEEPLSMNAWGLLPSGHHEVAAAEAGTSSSVSEVAVVEVGALSSGSKGPFSSHIGALRRPFVFKRVVTYDYLEAIKFPLSKKMVLEESFSRSQ